MSSQNQISSDDQQSLHWADKLAQRILQWQKQNQVSQLYADDMKTPSGRVHTGSLRGVILHDLVQKVLLNHTQQSVKSSFVFNDMDPMDGLPAYLDQKLYLPHMGKPLYKIPAPDLNQSGINFSQVSKQDRAKFTTASSFAEFYALDFIDAFRRLGCDQEIIWSHELYESGRMNDLIRLVLNHVQQVRQVYQRVAEYELPENWHPFQVICPECGKIGTTFVTGWDGEKVDFVCQKDKVDWAQGCGYQGQISPFDGNGKFLWKVDWPAHWVELGVTIEGSGKDHTSAGGSRDMANALLDEVFQSLVPFDIPYEWILIRGAKMSSSKGVGTSAREFVNLFSPEVGRFLFVSKHYNQVIDFDPETDSIPDLYDLYDQGCRIFWGEEEGDERIARAVELSQLNGQMPDSYFLPRFRDVAVWMQHPEMDLVAEFEKVKGTALTNKEKKELEDRQAKAEIWLQRYAPDEYQLTPTQDLPVQAKSLDVQKIDFVVKILNLAVNRDWKDAQQFQQEIYQQAKETVGAKQGFQAIYQTLIGKKHGPRAAWLILDTDKELLKQRIEQLKQQK